MAGKDFEAELIKAVEEVNGAHSSGTLKLADGERIDFKFGTPYHAVAGDSQGAEALDIILASILAGAEFTWDPAAIVDSDRATISLSSLRLVRRIKTLAESGRNAPPAVAKATGKSAAKGETKAPAAKPVVPGLDMALAAEKLPVLPEGSDFPHDQNSIPAILFHLSSGVIEVTSPRLRALVVVIDGRLTDAVAVVGSEFLEGPAALDAIALDPLKILKVCVLDSVAAAAIPLFWKLPVRVRDLQSRWVGGAAAAQGFIKPDARGALRVTADDDVAFVFFAQGQVLLAYSQKQPRPVTDLSVLASILGADSALISARVEDEISPAEVSTSASIAQPAAVTPPAPVAPPVAAPLTPIVAPEPVAKPSAPTPAPELVVTPPAMPELTPEPVIAPAPPVAPDATKVEPKPVAVPPTTPPTPAVKPTTPPAAVPPAKPEAVAPPWAAQPSTATDEPALDASILERIRTTIRTELKYHAPIVEAEFDNAEMTRSGLLKAARRVRAMRPRLISEERMESIGTRVINIITGREA